MMACIPGEILVILRLVMIVLSCWTRACSAISRIDDSIFDNSYEIETSFFVTLLCGNQITRLFGWVRIVAAQSFLLANVSSRFRTPLSFVFIRMSVTSRNRA